MRLPIAKSRHAFSLMEMVSAVAIAMLLLGALYVTLSTYMTNSKIGREITNESALARNLLARIGDDITGQIGAFDPRGVPVPESTDGSSTPSSSSSSSSSTPSSSSSSSSSSSTGSMNNSQGTTTMTSGDTVKYNFGVSGDTSALTLSTSRSQKARPLMNGAAPASELTSDLRCVMYWIVMNGSEPAGLARCEMKQATSQDIDLPPTNLPDQNKYIIAPEVKAILFEYWDGTAWQTSWDGTQPASEDGIVPLGPPSAIRVTVTFRRSATDSSDGATYQNVYALPTGNNFPQKATTP